MKTCKKESIGVYVVRRVSHTSLDFSLHQRRNQIIDIIAPHTRSWPSHCHQQHTWEEVQASFAVCACPTCGQTLVNKSCRKQARGRSRQFWNRNRKWDAGRTWKKAAALFVQFSEVDLTAVDNDSAWTCWSSECVRMRRLLPAAWKRHVQCPTLLVTPGSPSLEATLPPHTQIHRHTRPAIHRLAFPSAVLHSYDKVLTLIKY